MPVAANHADNGKPIKPPFRGGTQQALFGIDCFRDAERGFQELPGLFSTAVGYAAGTTPNSDYHEVCGDLTGHNKVVPLIFDPAATHNR